jgi:hypothetical protein
VDPEVVAAHAADQVLRTLVIVVEPQQQLGGQVALRELLNGLQHHLQDVGVESRHGGPLGVGSGVSHLSTLRTVAVLFQGPKVPNGADDRPTQAVAGRVVRLGGVVQEWRVRR